MKVILMQKNWRRESSILWWIMFSWHILYKSTSNPILNSIFRLIEKVGFNTEQVIDITYLFALEKPKPTQSIPQDEWISSIKSLSHSKLFYIRLIYLFSFEWKSQNLHCYFL
jgi:hypothetical protein